MQSDVVTNLGLQASPLIVSTDIRNMTDIMKSVLLNPEIIAVNQQASTPGDVMGTIPGGDKSAQVWVRPIADGSGVYVGVVNFASTEVTVSVPLSMVNPKWNAHINVDVRDLWARKDIGSATGKVTVSVASHDTVVLALSRD